MFKKLRNLTVLASCTIVLLMMTSCAPAATPTKAIVTATVPEVMATATEEIIQPTKPLEPTQAPTATVPVIPATATPVPNNPETRDARNKLSRENMKAPKGLLCVFGSLAVTGELVNQIIPSTWTIPDALTYAGIAGYPEHRNEPWCEVAWTIAPNRTNNPEVLDSWINTTPLYARTLGVHAEMILYVTNPADIVPAGESRKVFTATGLKQIKDDGLTLEAIGMLLSAIEPTPTP